MLLRLLLFTGLVLFGCGADPRQTDLASLWSEASLSPSDRAMIHELVAHNARAQSRMGQAADLVNVVVVGSRSTLRDAFRAAGWMLADPRTPRTDAKIASDVLLNRSYPSAPVSTLRLFGRPQDLAFEAEVDHSPRRRHHIRFWQAPTTVADGTTVWLGGAVFDISVAISRVGGVHFTHRVDRYIDRERDFTGKALKATGLVTDVQVQRGFGPSQSLKNADGHPMETDGDVWIVRLTKDLPESTPNGNGYAT